MMIMTESNNSPKSIDNLLIDDIVKQQQPNDNQPEPQPVEVHQLKQPEVETSTVETQSQENVSHDVSQTTPQEQTKTTDDSPIDEYGNPVEKPRMYTQDEVQQMIRDRLSRGKYAQEQIESRPIQQPVQQIQDQQSTGEEDWQQQLNNYIDNRLTEKQREIAERQWREQELRRQEEFQDKFTSGMNKYSDFRDVVAGKPITDNMMLATRSLENPAAFIYGAAKLHPQELERISKINDPYVQAAEVGRLHEKMVKQRNAASSQSRPLEAPKGDMAMKGNMGLTLDQKLKLHEKQKFTRNR
jgi:polyhydroxyalkanoate synthesis regulator phasin